MLQLRARVKLGAMAMKGYSAFLKAPVLLEPPDQIVSVISRIVVEGSLIPLQRRSRRILQPQMTGQFGNCSGRINYSLYPSYSHIPCVFVFFVIFQDLGNYPFCFLLMLLCCPPRHQNSTIHHVLFLAVDYQQLNFVL